MTKQQAVEDALARWNGSAPSIQIVETYIRPVDIYHAPWWLEIFMVLVILFLLALTFDFFRACVTKQWKASHSMRGLCMCGGFLCSMTTAFLVWIFYITW